jgi:transposase
LKEGARRGVPLRRYASLLADKGYDSETCRAQCPAHGLTPLIPRRRTADSCTGRYVVEQAFGLIDQFRRLRVRYESSIRNFKSMHYIGCGAIVARR